MGSQLLSLCLFGTFLYFFPSSVSASSSNDALSHSVTYSDESPSFSTWANITRSAPHTHIPLEEVVPEGEQILAKFKKYINTPLSKRPGSFCYLNSRYEVNFANEHLEIRGHYPAPFLEVCPHATHVSLSGARGVPVETLGKHLQELDLFGCEFDLNDAFIEHLGQYPDLYSLVIVGKRYYPQVISEVTHIGFERTIDWGYKPLRASFTSLAPVDHLRTLRLETMKFTHLPEDICLLSNLTTLSLRNNYDLGDLPSKMSLLSNLTNLDIKDTHIHALPTWLCELKNLEHLHVGYMDDEIAQVPNKWRTKGLVHDLSLKGLPASLSFHIPQDIFKNMRGLIIQMPPHAAYPYLESTLKNGFISYDESGIYQIPMRKKHRRLSYIAKNFMGK